VDYDAGTGDWFDCVLFTVSMAIKDSVQYTHDTNKTQMVLS